MGTSKDHSERLEVRSMWQDEALDFTPWLACNLDSIGKVIGKNLEFIEREKKVGPFLLLDILAKETDSGKAVAIENQLEWSDTDHMGRLIAYATNVDARIAIWVAPEFLYEHAKVLNRLNEWTRDDIEFYGLKIEVVRNTNDSDPEPRLLKVVYPGGWDLESTLPVTAPDPPHIQKYTNFFEPLIRELFMTGFYKKLPTKRFDHTGRFFPSVINEGIWYAASLEGKNDAWVTVHIETDSDEATKRVFDRLKAEMDRIESSIVANPDPEWSWRRHNGHTFSSINIRMDGSINDPADKLEKTRAWMLDLLPKLKEEFEPRVAKILADSE